MLTESIIKVFKVIFFYFCSMDMLSTPSLGSMNLVKHIAKGDSNEKKGVNYF